jgi:hypothetical protein
MLMKQYQPVVEARSQTPETNNVQRSSRRRTLEEAYEDETRDGNFNLGLPHWYYLSHH